MIWLQILIFLVILYLAFAFYQRKKQIGPTRTYPGVDLTSKVCIITGCSAGVGKETARELANRNATVIFACRNEAKTLPILNEIKNQTKNQKLFFIHLDLSKLSTIYLFAEKFKKEYDRLDILVNNAGLGLQKQLNENGVEKTIFVNHLGHFLLTSLLMTRIAVTPESRIINVSSAYHSFIKETTPVSQVFKGQIKEGQQYMYSKYYNVLFTQALQKKIDEKNYKCKVVSVHPGFVDTEIFYKYDGGLKSYIFRLVIFQLLKPLQISPTDGARTSLYCCLQDWSVLVPSAYYSHNEISTSSNLSRQGIQEDELWSESEKVLKIKFEI